LLNLFHLTFANIPLTDDTNIDHQLVANNDLSRNELRNDRSSMLNGTSSHKLSALSSHQFEEEAANNGAVSSIVPSRSVQQFLIGSPPGLKRGTDVFDRDDSISVKLPDYEFNNDIPPVSGRPNRM
jgi:hypothetical protein